MQNVLKTASKVVFICIFCFRYLTFPAGEFAAGPAKSGLLTQQESFAILMNISAPGSWEMPDYMNTETEPRKIPNDSMPMLASGKIVIRQTCPDSSKNQIALYFLGVHVWQKMRLL